MNLRIPFYSILATVMLVCWPTIILATTTNAQIFAEHSLTNLTFDQRVEILNLAKMEGPTLLKGGITNNIEFTGAIDAFSLVFDPDLQVDPDPLLNLRLEIFNPSDEAIFFNFQIKIPTDVTKGPTFNNTFANVELFDDNNDGIARLGSPNAVNAFFEVIDDPLNGVAINGSALLGENFSYRGSGEGKVTLFDNDGVGPNSDDFMGDGFNFMRFLIGGSLSAGDRAVITAMGCYSNEEDYCPERYEIPASPIPVPATAWLFISGLLGLVYKGRKARQSVA